MSSRPYVFTSPADREGFEPSIRFEPYTHFPGVRLEPLGHLSKVVAGEEVRPARPLSQRSRISRPSTTAPSTSDFMGKLTGWADTLSRSRHLGSTVTSHSPGRIPIA